MAVDGGNDPEGPSPMAMEEKRLGLRVATQGWGRGWLHPVSGRLSRSGRCLRGEGTLKLRNPGALSPPTIIPLPYPVTLRGPIRLLHLPHRTSMASRNQLRWLGDGLRRLAMGTRPEKMKILGPLLGLSAH